MDEGWELEHGKRGKSAGFVSNGAATAVTSTSLPVYPVRVPVLYQGRDPLAPLYALDKEN